MRFMIPGVLVALLSPVAFGRPYFMSKVELIKKAQVIAILRISHVEPVEVVSSTQVYRQSALATVERVIKGNISGSVTLYGQQTSEARVDFAPGRYLVFLSRDGDLLVGTNWHLSVRPINKGKVEWYASNKGYVLKTTQLSLVLKEIESIVSTSSLPLRRKRQRHTNLEWTWKFLKRNWHSTHRTASKQGAQSRQG